LFSLQTEMHFNPRSSASQPVGLAQDFQVRPQANWLAQITYR